MKKLILIALLMLAAKFGFSQTTYSYYTVDSFIVQVAVKEKPTFTGKYFVTANGQVCPIMVSSQGHFFIERVSKKTGKKYRQYL